MLGQSLAAVVGWIGLMANYMGNAAGGKGLLMQRGRVRYVLGCRLRKTLLDAGCLSRGGAGSHPSDHGPEFGA